MRSRTENILICVLAYIAILLLIDIIKRRNGKLVLLRNNKTIPNNTISTNRTTSISKLYITQVTTTIIEQPLTHIRYFNIVVDNTSVQPDITNSSYARTDQQNTIPLNVTSNIKAMMHQNIPKKQIILARYRRRDPISEKLMSSITDTNISMRNTTDSSDIDKYICPSFRFGTGSTITLVLIGIAIVVLLCLIMMAFAMCNDIVPCLMIILGLLAISSIVFFVLCSQNKSCMNITMRKATTIDSAVSKQISLKQTNKILLNIYILYMCI